MKTNGKTMASVMLSIPFKAVNSQIGGADLGIRLQFRTFYVHALEPEWSDH